MENIEKYIFDPKDPKKCKVYGLLLNIMKKKNFETYLSPLFFIQYYRKEFETRLRDETWDIPENYDKLDLESKIEVFTNQNSFIDFVELIVDKYFIGNKFQNFYDLFNNIKLPEIILSYNTKIKKNTSLKEYLEDVLAYNYEFVSSNYFISNNNIRLIDKYTEKYFTFTSFSRSIIIITESFFTELEKKNIIPKNTHPLIIKKMDDFNLLFDILQRDLKSITNTAISKIPKISYLNNIDISKYLSLEKIKLDSLKNKKEIYILGENGDGKTLFLQSLILALKNDNSGKVNDFIKSFQDTIKLSITTDDKKTSTFNDDIAGSCNLFAYGVNRHRNDSDQKEEFGYLTLFDSEQYLNNPVKWLQYLDYKKAKDEKDTLPLDTAIEMLKNILDENINIKVDTDKVVFYERETKTEFEQLSEGYKSVIIWVCDLIQRLSNVQPDVYLLKDYKATVLVDEIDLHLHPIWQYRIVRKLRSWFENIQFIFTTHSPTVILGSSDDAVFYKLYKENGVTHISQPVNSIKNLMANSILTSPLFNNERAGAFNSSPKDVDTSDDFLYSKIHKEIAEKIKGDKSITEKDIVSLVQEAIKNDKDK